MSYKCEIVADSINSNNNRLTTFLITYPRIIHSELMTHRVFSRNSASSRAIPFEKMVKMVEEDPFIPIAWQKDHKGMQGTEYWTDDDTVTVDEGDEYERYTKIYSATEHFITEWLEARDLVVAQSYELNRLGVTKQLCNRLLEPFMWHTTLVSATEFSNFFKLRCPQYNYLFDFYKSKKDVLKASKDGKYNDGRNFSDFTTEDWLGINSSQAEIHIQALAEAMWDAMNESIPNRLKAGEWHIPFGDKINAKHFTIFKSNLWKNKQAPTNGHNDLIIKIATARAARLSYMTFDGEIDYQKDIELHDRLLESKHLSPFEHCARAMSDEEYYSFVKGTIPTQIDKYGITNLEMMPVSSGHPIVGFTGLNPTNGDKYGWCNNFRGFIQYRHIIENK